MANECLFPDGSTLTTSSGFAATVQQISGFNRSLATADVTPLEQGLDSNGKPTAKRKKAAKTFDHDPITVTFFFHPAHELPPLGEDQEFTITFPDGTSKQLNGDGFIVGDSTGDLVSGEVMVGTYQFMFEGGDDDIVETDNPPTLENVA